MNHEPDDYLRIIIVCQYDAADMCSSGIILVDDTKNIGEKIMSETIIVKEWKKFRRYKDGAEYYNIGKTAFMQIAKDANAIYKVGKIVLVNCEILENYLEGFRLKN